MQNEESIHKYVTVDQYKERINNDKEEEAQRKAEIYR